MAVEHLGDGKESIQYEIRLYWQTQVSSLIISEINQTQYCDTQA